MKIKLTICYDGTHYNGSQIQPDFPTIHSKLLEVFSIINIHTTLDFSGRTDKVFMHSNKLYLVKFPLFGKT